MDSGQQQSVNQGQDDVSNLGVVPEVDSVQQLPVSDFDIPKASARNTDFDMSQYRQGNLANQDSIQLTSNLPQIAADNDVIEKEWVDALDEVIRRTSDNPFLQQEEISKVKVEYMKKRYNKDIKKGE